MYLHYVLDTYQYSVFIIQQILFLSTGKLLNYVDLSYISVLRLNHCAHFASILLTMAYNPAAVRRTLSSPRLFRLRLCVQADSSAERSHKIERDFWGYSAQMRRLADEWIFRQMQMQIPKVYWK